MKALMSKNKFNLVKIKIQGKCKNVNRISYPKVILGEIRGDEIIKLMPSVEVEHQ